MRADRCHCFFALLRSFLDAPLPGNYSAWERVFTSLQSNLVFETHIYSWSGYGKYTDDCAAILPAFDKAVGWPNRQHWPHVLTEIGLNQDVYPKDETDYQYFHCVGQWVMQHRMGWGIWLFGGSYYIRDGKPNQPDTFGSTYANFTGYKSQEFLQTLREITWEKSEAEEVSLRVTSE